MLHLVDQLRIYVQPRRPQFQFLGDGVVYGCGLE